MNQLNELKLESPLTDPEFIHQQGAAHWLQNASPIDREYIAQIHGCTRMAEALLVTHRFWKLVSDRALCKARRAYVAPLKEKIERLGRLVFDSSFEVEVTENLSVASRTMEGSNVPFESLSGGTKEQISLISRLACAMTISKDGGASLILDDALGYTDPQRLKLMGAVLAKAGKECQIIILTCVPDRYNNVGEATVVRLG